jgi:hypothetical protein
MKSQTVLWVLAAVASGVLVVMGTIQVVPVVPDPGNPPITSEPSWDKPETRALAVRACFDCHSHETVTPWYGKVAPFSWLVRDHIIDARSKLNFSTWDQPQEEAEEAGEVVSEGEMPPGYYTALHGAAVLSRLVRSSMLETLSADYVRTARAKGLPIRRVVMGHALRNALLPVISVVGLQFGALLGGAVLTEGIFGWPGLGQLAVNAISQRDIPLVQGIVLVFALMFALVNLMVDVLYVVVDPRVRLR